MVPPGSRAAERADRTADAPVARALTPEAGVRTVSSPIRPRREQSAYDAVGFLTYPEHPPRERLEWLLAASRVLFVAGALLAVMIHARRPPQYSLIVSSLVIYLVYSLAIIALVWRPVGFGRGWAVALHAFDLVAFSWLTIVTTGTASPFFMSYVFLVICGTLRWQMWGALATGALSIAALALVTWLPSVLFRVTPGEFDGFVIRSTQLAVMAALLGHLGSYHQRFQREIVRLTAWPRRIPEDRQALVTEVVEQCVGILDTPRVLLVWEEPGAGDVNLAWMSAAGQVGWSREPEGTYESLVAPRLEQASFQTLDAADEAGRVLYRVNAGFRQCVCRPLNEALRSRFDVMALQSWVLDGELVKGRLFALDKARLEIDALTIGDLVARLAASRLDGLYVLRDLRQTAALRERVKVASDLHDSLLQSLAGVGLQLMVARRLLDRDPVRAGRQLDDIQKQIEQGELEMRGFIRRLRPQTTVTSDAPPLDLSERLANLARRLERQWSVKVRTTVDGATNHMTDGFGDEVFRIAREGILNAARHADASVVSAELSSSNDAVRMEIVDDGGGFPFQGTYDLDALERMNKGPWSLKERVATLQGTLELTSTDSGSRLIITLPLPHQAG